MDFLQQQGIRVEVIPGTSAKKKHNNLRRFSFFTPAKSQKYNIRNIKYEYIAMKPLFPYCSRKQD